MRKASARFLIGGSYSSTEHLACTLFSSIFDIYTSAFESFANFSNYICQLIKEPLGTALTLFASIAGALILNLAVLGIIQLFR